ncbi:MAG: SBBP repeat-containing protein [Flavobacteriaceae bacterium]
MRKDTFYIQNIVRVQAVLFLIFALPLQTLKAQSDPKVLWAKRFGGTLSYSGGCMTSDASGNVYVTGQFEGTADFGNNTFSTTDNIFDLSDAFVLKTDTSGTVLWAEQFGGESMDEGISIAIDASDNVYTAGRFGGTATFGNLTLTSENSDVNVFYNSVYITKQDTSGEVLWVSEFFGEPDISLTEYVFNIFSITTDTQGNIYTLGTFNTVTATFGNITLNRISNYNSLTFNDMFIVKQDATGQVLWAENFGTINTDTFASIIGYDITTDASDNLYITGNFEGTVVFGDATFSSYSPYSGDSFVLKMDALGEVVWVKQFELGGTTISFSLCITTDATGNVYVAGVFQGEELNIDDITLSSVMDEDNDYYTGDVFAVKISSLGQVLWAKSYGGTGNESASDITVDASGKVYITGHLNGVANFSGNFLVSEGSNDVFVLKTNNAGVVEWVEGFGWTGSDSGKGIIVDSSGNIYVTGEFEDTVSFGSTDLTATGYKDMFLIKLSSDDLATEQYLSEQWKVYPNPVQDILTIEVPQTHSETSVELYNLLGQKIMEYNPVNNTEHIDVSGLAQGVYLLTIRQNGINKTVKIKKKD